jgi:hypothetical protein
MLLRKIVLGLVVLMHFEYVLMHMVNSYDGPRFGFLPEPEEDES